MGPPPTTWDTLCPSAPEPINVSTNFLEFFFFYFVNTLYLIVYLHVIFWPIGVRGPVRSGGVGTSLRNILSSPMARPDVLISGEEVAKHNTRESCWIIVHGEVDSSNRDISHIPFGTGNVYDVTKFLDGMHHMNITDSY